MFIIRRARQNKNAVSFFFICGRNPVTSNRITTGDSSIDNVLYDTCDRVCVCERRCLVRHIVRSQPCSLLIIQKHTHRRTCISAGGDASRVNECRIGSGAGGGWHRDALSSVHFVHRQRTSKGINHGLSQMRFWWKRETNFRVRYARREIISKTDSRWKLLPVYATINEKAICISNMLYLIWFTYN